MKLSEKVLCKDIQKMSSSCQTSRLDGFHSCIICLLLKKQPFSYLGRQRVKLLTRLHQIFSALLTRVTLFGTSKLDLLITIFNTLIVYLLIHYESGSLKPVYLPVVVGNVFLIFFDCKSRQHDMDIFSQLLPAPASKQTIRHMYIL